MIRGIERRAIGRAHSKLILMGEHAVVYGEPAIAVPFDAVHIEAEIQHLEGPVLFISDFFQGELEKMPKRMQGFVACIKAVCETLNQPIAHFRVQLKSTIPIGRGLGSSAAIAVALVKGLYSYFQKPLNRLQLQDFVDLAETFAHGNPSGIDREAITANHPIWFERQKPVETIRIEKTLHIVVADTGRVGDTHAAVSSVKALYSSNQDQTKATIEQLGQLTHQSRFALTSGRYDRLGLMLDQAHTLLQRLGVSDPGLDHYVQVSKEAGALGAKLTGSGRGGCMIALAPSLEKALKIERELEAIGAENTWYCQLTNEVIDYESKSSRTY
ncbi:mevalonate kinase [Amphibacillus marinus]|uniref:mevalonate kinase n=1 Tax=Amphibacillus marinus TaxID=872970 RepID=A0A1H8K5V1_9BACI|nr:mevalonate kinase [Amphibacillus marinus]SEN87836.1 mevalonate kinase [Amphibacillus marinus]